MSSYYQRRNQRGSRNINTSVPFSGKELQDLSKKDPTCIISGISDNIKRFQQTLSHQETCRKEFQLIISLLHKVSFGLSSQNDDVRTRAINILGEALSDRCTAFINNLKQFSGGKGNFTKNVGCLCDLFKVLLDKLPDSSWSILPVDELHETIQLYCDNSGLDKNFLSKSEELVKLRKDIKDANLVKVVASKCAVAGAKRPWDNSEYRDLKILPQWEEISSPRPPYKLRPNIVKGSYDDWMHYFDVQFRLLREDFISPLRKGINDYLQGKSGRDLRNIKVYNKVRILRALFTKAGLCHRVGFDPTPYKTYRWEHSKRLIFGSLLCLSPDHFHNKVLFAVVSNRDLKELSKGVLEVMFHGATDLLAHMTTNTEFVMVESLAYFEASRHILRSLQTAKVETMPFTKYLIANNCATVDHPRYLNSGDTSSLYDIQFIVNPGRPSSFSAVDIKCNAQWPTLEMTELDESQLKAMKKALTHEISVIQGPPGTGKTYMGLKIVQALLKNRSTWNTASMPDLGGLRGFRYTPRALKSPILVMCFTNHALDQFLEGILDMHEGENVQLVRIGGRSKNEKIQECSLYNVRGKLKNTPKDEYVRMKNLAMEAEDEGRQCSYQISTLMCNLPRHFVGFGEIKRIIDDHLYSSLIEHSETEEEEKVALELWLGIYMKEVHEEYIPSEDPPSESGEDSNSDETSSEESSESDEEDSSTDSEETSKDEEEEEETINVTGDAAIEEDARMVDGMTEMFKEMNFESDSQEKQLVRRKKVRRPKFYRHRTFKIIKHQDTEWLKGHIMWVPTMHEKEVEKINNVHNLKLEDRYRLYKYWHGKYKGYLMNQLEESCETFNEKCKTANEAKQRADRHTLEAADIIGMTTTGAAKYQHVLHLVKPRIVIVEEAAEVLESHIVSALSAGTQHLILIGDHKQLRPNPNEYDLAVKYKLDISLFERLVENNFPHVTLKIQHRMRPEIADLVRHHIYDELHDHSIVQSYPKVKGVSSNLFFIQHKELEKGSDLSHSNEYEAQYLSCLCKFILQQGYSPSQITILVTYTGQLLLMKKMMPKATFEGVRVTTVDNFQGEENDIILLSLVRSNDRGVIGFLKEDNRICVALSRAKHGFYCMGNFEILRNGSETWKNIVSDLESKGKLGESLSIHCNNHPQYLKSARYPGDFAKHFPTGGCQRPCEYRLTCGHVCALTCHSDDPEHEKYVCKKPVTIECPKGHTFERLCYMDPRCCEEVERTLPGCGHTMRMRCFEDPSELQCKKVCEKINSLCGHTQRMPCFQDPLEIHCKAVCTKVIPDCGHEQEMFCHHNPHHIMCRHKCERSCANGHPCPLLCSEPCNQCSVSSEVKLPDCGHTQTKLCYQSLSDVKCTAACEKKCRSGHPCKHKCHEKCQPCRVTVHKTFPCGHTTKVRCLEELSAQCKLPCSKELPCGHQCQLTCGEECSDASCPQLVQVSLPRCSHNTMIPCPMKKNLIYRRRVKCTEVCQKQLRCGHQCTSICGEPCTSKCEVNGVRFTCKQGHKLVRKCYQTLDSCDQKCTKKLSCGHPCQGKCGKECNDALCIFPVIKTSPCGHNHRLHCSTPIETHPCDIICRAPLACGHSCRGKCSECSSTRIHKPCEYSVKLQHFCGEQVVTSCGGLRDLRHNADKPVMKVLHCIHTQKPFECAMKEVYKCSEPCEWSCTHHKCSKLCHETCNRPPCDKRCPVLLECKHQCMGLCGEPCITTCPPMRL